MKKVCTANDFGNITKENRFTQQEVERKKQLTLINVEDHELYTYASPTKATATVNSDERKNVNKTNAI